MTQGCLIFAHNGAIDYGSQAVLAAKLAIKHLRVPVSLAADKDTIADIKSQFSTLPFDQIIEISKPPATNKRMLSGEHIDFLNSNRTSAYDVTPYYRTLLIDADFLIFSKSLSKYWDATYDFLITPGMLVLDDNIDPTKYKISDSTINLLWATNIMFSKSPEVKLLFDLVDYIQSEYEYFSHLYEFNNTQYRNDFAFSIACHTMSGYGIDPWHGTLPVPLFFPDNTELFHVKENGQLGFLSSNSILTRSCQQDVHVMNKRSLLANIDSLMKLADE